MSPTHGNMKSGSRPHFVNTFSRLPRKCSSLHYHVGQMRKSIMLLCIVLLLTIVQRLPAPIFDESTPVPAPTAVLTPKPPIQGSPSQDSSAAAPRVTAYLS